MATFVHDPREAQDERYFRERAAFAQRYKHLGLWHVMDHWSAYCGVENLARALYIVEALRSTLRVPGDAVECGAWRGATTLLMAKVLKIETRESTKHVQAFDTWQGFQGWGPHDNEQTRAEYDVDGPQANRFVETLAELRDLIALYDLPVTLHQGFLQQTLPAFVRDLPGWKCAFVYLDVDLYEPTKAALDALYPHLSPGAIILCDEYSCPQWPGETCAVDEHLAAHPGAYRVEALTTVRQPTLKLIRQ